MISISSCNNPDVFVNLVIDVYCIVYHIEH